MLLFIFSLIFEANNLWEKEILNRYKCICPLNEMKSKTIDYSTQVDCLGVVLDEKLPWPPQISKMSMSLQKLKKYKISAKEISRGIYFKTISLAIPFNMSTLGNLQWHLFGKIEKIDKRAARIAYNIKWAYTNEDMWRIGNRE